MQSSSARKSNVGPEETEPLAGTTFCNLPQELAAELKAISHTIPYPARAVVFSEGQAPPGVFLIRQGRVKLSLFDFGGGTLILKVAGPGELLALSDTISGRNCQLRAETLGPCKLDFVARGHFLRFVQAHHELGFLVARELSNTFMATSDWLGSLALARWASAKLARLLWDWAQAGSEEHPPAVIELLLTYEELGQMIGATRETVNRVLSEFQKRQIIQLRGSTVRVLDRTALAAIARKGRRRSAGSRLVPGPATRARLAAGWGPLRTSA